MTSPIFAPRAQRELREAAVWVAEDNPAAADALLAAAISAARRLQARPKLGRVRLELAPERYRFWSLRGFPYLLVYDAEAEPPITELHGQTAGSLPRPHRDPFDRMLIAQATLAVLVSNEAIFDHYAVRRLW